MKPTLGDPFPPDWPGYPEQMSAEDHQIWLRFRELYSQEFKAFYFSVHVGEPIMWTEGLEEELALMVEHISRRRIDAVGEKDHEWWLIEFRKDAGPGAIGSILTYKILWEEDPPDNRPVVPVIVTDVMDVNIFRVCNKLNIVYLVV